MFNNPNQNLTFGTNNERHSGGQVFGQNNMGGGVFNLPTQ